MPSSVIPKEQLTAYQRWELATLDEQQLGGASRARTGKPGASDSVVISNAPDDVALPTAQDIQQIHDQAYKEGYALGQKEGEEAGRQAGYEVGRKAGEQDAQRLNALVASLEDEKLRQDEQLAAEVLSLSLAIARQIVRVALETRPALILEAIRDALAGLPSLSGHLRIVVNPADADTVRQWLQHEHGHLSSKVIEDVRVEPGGFRFETGQSELSGELPKRWQEVVERLGADRSWLA